MGGELAQRGHRLVDVAVDHRPLDAEILGDELRRLVLEFDPLENFKLAQRDAGAEVFDQRGEQ